MSHSDHDSMSSSGDSKFRLDELSLQASALRAQILERCRRTLNHDLNNSIQSIHSGLELLSKCVSSPGALRVSPQECLHLLQQQFSNLQTTFRKLLSEIAEPPGEPEVVDLSEMLNAALQALRHERAISKAKVQLDPGLSVNVRKINLRSVLFGMLFDAIDHLPPDATVNIEAQRRDGTARVQIRIDASAFESQADQQDAALSELLGALVQAEGGELHVDRAASYYALVMTLRSAPSQTADAAPATTATSAKVLIADRNRDAADSLAMILQLEGHVAQTVYVGAELKAALDAFSPDIVLIDSDLPGCNPVEVASAVRARKGTRPLLAQVSSSDRAAHVAFDANLIRPVEWPQLQRLLHLRPFDQ
jgi:CheY-like chemotaxis protein